MNDRTGIVGVIHGGSSSFKKLNSHLLGKVAIQPAFAEVPKVVTDLQSANVLALIYFDAEGLPSPVCEHRFHESRKWRFDYAWPKFKVALEVEGGAWTNGRHTRGKGFIGDTEKYSTAASLGWLVIRVTPSDLATARTVQFLRGAMAASNACT